MPHLARVEVAKPGLRQPLPRAHLAARRAARRSSPPATRFGTLRRARGPADQPRVRVGQPHRAAARRRRALGRGRRRDREPARGAGRRGAPRVLPERHRQPARHVPRLALRALPGRAAARRRVPGPVPRRPGGASCAPSSATTSRPTTRASGACSRIVEGLRDDLDAHRRALRHVVLRAHAARARRGRRRARACSTTKGVVYERRRRALVAHHRLRRLSATACSSKSDGSTTYLCNDLAYHRDKFAPRLHAPDRHLGRRPPRPGEVDAGRAWRRSASGRPPSPRCCSASS